MTSGHDGSAKATSRAQQEANSIRKGMELACRPFTATAISHPRSYHG